MRWPMLALLVACRAPEHPPDDTDTDADADTDRDTDCPVDERDQDRDCWTVENGDCDDTDPRINPGRIEDPSNGVDDDCDGRVDEVMAGVEVFLLDAAATTRVVRIDTFGDVVGERDLGVAIAPTRLVDKPDNDGWYVWDLPAASLWDVPLAGEPTPIVDLSAFPWPPPSEGGPLLTPPTGLAADRAGNVYLSGTNQLLRLRPDGGSEPEVAARWPCLEEDGEHELAATALTVNPTNGTVGLFGAFGGFATWHPERGFQVHVPEDPEDWHLRFSVAFGTEKGAFFALGTDTRAGETRIYQADADDGALTLRGRWVRGSTGEPERDYAPVTFAVDTEGGTHFHVSANGGWYRTVYKVFHDGDASYASQLYTNVLGDPPDPGDAGRRFGALAIHWDEK